MEQDGTSAAMEQEAGGSGALNRQPLDRAFAAMEEDYTTYIRQTMMEICIPTLEAAILSGSI